MAEMKAVEIFGVGTWNGQKFVQEDLTEIVNNTNTLMAQGKHKPPIKLGHSDKQILGQNDGQPALGWPNNFVVIGAKITADFGDMPDILYKAIEKKLFTQVSIEMDHIKNFGWFITAVSVLGADLPAVKSLEDLQTFLADAEVSSKINTASVLQFSEPHFLKPSQIGGEKTMSDAKYTDAAGDALAAENKRLKDDAEAAKTALADSKDKDVKLTDAEKELAQYKTKETERSFTEKKEAILKQYNEDAKAGKLAPAIVDKVTAYIDGQKATFSEGTELFLSPELAQEVGKAYAEKLDKSESASDGGRELDQGETPDMALSREIAVVMAGNSGLSYMDADAIVMTTKPKVYADYQEWSNKVAMGGN